MTGFSTMMWFISGILIFLSISLLKGNCSRIHGKAYEIARDSKEYVKALGKQKKMQ